MTASSIDIATRRGRGNGHSTSIALAPGNGVAEPVGRQPVALPAEAGVDEVAGHFRDVLELIGEDPQRTGLVKTPSRAANALRWLTSGYDQTAADVVGDALFEEDHDSMVLVRDIEFYSLCEHHLLPFFGEVHIAYIPNGRVVGLSKLPRIVEVFARRLQIQERLSDDIADAIQSILNPKGVGVVVEGAHMCMRMRGVEKQSSKTITSALRGTFRDDAKTRDEFLNLVHGASGSSRY